jgi:hypothetical protein
LGNDCTIDWVLDIKIEDLEQIVKKITNKDSLTVLDKIRASHSADVDVHRN